MCENKYLKALGPPIELLDAIKGFSLFKDVHVFYVEDKIPKHRCLA